MMSLNLIKSSAMSFSSRSLRLSVECPGAMLEGLGKRLRISVSTLGEGELGAADMVREDGIGDADMLIAVLC